MKFLSSIFPFLLTVSLCPTAMSSLSSTASSSSSSSSSAVSSTKDLLISTPRSTTDKSDMGPLHSAAYKGDIAEAKRLIGLGYDSEEFVSAPYGMSPLMYAAQAGHVEMMKFLLSKEGKARVTLDAKSPLIHLAVDSGSQECVEYCLSLGFSVHKYNEAREQPLHRAVWRKKVSLVDFLLSKGAEIDSTVRTTGDTPFLLATKTGQLDLMKQLKARGANVTLKNLRLRSALHIAAEGGTPEIIQACIDWGLKVDDVDDLGRTSLHYAVSSGKSDAVQVVLKQRPDVEKADTLGETPLLGAVSRKFLAIAQLLWKVKSDARVQYKDGRGLLHAAAQSGSPEMVAWCLSAAPCSVTSRDSCCRTPLHYAVESESLESVRKLCTKETVNVPSHGEETPLHCALRKNNVQLATYLVENGALLSFTQSDGTTYLHFAALNNADKVISYLLIKGLSTTAPDTRGWTPLHCAANDRSLVKALDALLAPNLSAKERRSSQESSTSSTHVETQTSSNITHLGIAAMVVNTVISAISPKTYLYPPWPPSSVSPVDAHTLRNETALMLAAKAGNKEALTKLKTVGADLMAVDCDGTTALELALYSGHDECALLLLPPTLTRNQVQTITKWALLAAHKECMRFVGHLLDQEGFIDLSITDTEERSLLHYVALAGDSALIRRILSMRRLSLNSQDSRKRTPLICAVLAGRAQALQELTTSKADLSVCDDSGQTALHVALANGSLEAGQCLIDHGAAVDTQDNKGRTPFHTIRSIFSSEQTLGFLDRLFKDNQSRKKIVTIRDNEGCTLLDGAVAARDLPLIDFLVFQGGDIKTTREDGNTLVHGAVAVDSPKTVEHLIKKGCSPLVKNKKGIYPIHQAIIDDKDTDILKFLKSSENARTPDGETALMLAVRRQNSHAVRALLSLQAQDLQNHFNYSALMVAASTGDEHSFSALIEAADTVQVSLRSRDQKTVLHHLAHGGSVANLELFKRKFPQHYVRQSTAYDSDGYTPLHSALLEHKPDIAAWLITNSAQIEQKTRSGETALALAVCRGDRSSAQLLKERRVSLEPIATSGDSLIHLAVQSGSPDMVTLCLSWGLDPNAKNKLGYAPLHAAALRSLDECAQVLLADNRVDRTAKTDQGETVADITAQLRENRVPSTPKQTFASFARGTMDQFEKAHAHNYDLIAVHDIQIKPMTAKRVDRNLKTDQEETLADVTAQLTESTVPSTPNQTMDNKFDDDIIARVQASRLKVILGVQESRRFMDNWQPKKTDQEETLADVTAQLTENTVASTPNQTRDDDDNDELISDQDKADEELLQSIVTGDMTLFEKALRDNANINFVHPITGYTPLHVASGDGNLAAVKRLCELKATMTIRANDGQTPIEHATLNGHRKCAAYLTQMMNEHKK